MEPLVKAKSVGVLGMGVLLISYVRLFGFRFLSPVWAIVILVLSAVSFISFIAAGRMSSKWWYLGTLFSLGSALLVFAFAWG